MSSDLSRVAKEALSNLESALDAKPYCTIGCAALGAAYEAVERKRGKAGNNDDPETRLAVIDLIKDATKLRQGLRKCSGRPQGRECALHKEDQKRYFPRAS